MKYFGHSISEKGIQSDADKVRALCELPPPTNVTELRSLCGMLNYLSKYIPGMTSVLKPVMDLLKNYTAWRWGPKQERAVIRVKSNLRELPTLDLYHAWACEKFRKYVIKLTISL